MAKWNIDLTDYKLVKYPVATPYGSMNSGASANTFTGTYQEAVAASAIATVSYLVGIYVHQGDSSVRATEIKVGVGGAGSEVDIGFSSGHGSGSIPIGWMAVDPVKIAANARIAVDVRDDEAAANAIYWAILLKVPQ